jgi:hypothetical protein
MLYLFLVHLMIVSIARKRDVILWFCLAKLFEHEDGNDILFRNIGLFLNSEDRSLHNRRCNNLKSIIISYYIQSFWEVKGGRRVRLTTLPPSVSRLSKENVGASTSHNPMGLHGLLQGYLYIFCTFYYILVHLRFSICVMTFHAINLYWHYIWHLFKVP